MGRLKNMAGDYSLLDAGGRKLDVRNISTKRIGKVFELAVKSTDDGLYNISLNSVQKEHILLFDNTQFQNDLAENIAPAIVSISDKYSHILAPSSTFGKNIMPRVAALLDVAQISDIVSIENKDTFVRPIYAGNANLKLQSTDTKKIITVRTTNFEATKINGGNGKITKIETNL